MKYNLNQTFVDLEGNPVLEGVGETAKPATLRHLLTVSLLNADPQKYADGDAKYKLYKFVRRLNAKVDELAFPSEDIVLLKDCVARVYSPYVVGCIFDVLEQADAG